MNDESRTDEAWVPETRRILQDKPCGLSGSQLENAIHEIADARKMYTRYAQDKEMRRGVSRRATVKALREASNEFRSALKCTDLMSYDRIAAGIGGEESIARLYRLLDEMEVQSDAILTELGGKGRGKDHALWQWIEMMADIFGTHAGREPAMHGSNQDPSGSFWELLQAARPRVNGTKVTFSPSTVRKVIRGGRRTK